MKTEDICKLLDKPVSTCTVAHVLKKKLIWVWPQKNAKKTSIE